MKCDNVRTELVAYLDGELTAEVQTELKGHLQGCDACRAELDALVAAQRTMDALPATEPTEDFRRRFWERFEQQHSGGALDRVLGWLRRPRPAILLGAGVVASVLAVILLVRPGEGPAGKADRMIASHMELFSDYEAIRNLDILEDMEFIESLDDEV